MSDGNVKAIRDDLVKTLDKLRAVTVADWYDSFLMDNCVIHIGDAISALSAPDEDTKGGSKVTLNELNRFFDKHDKVKSRIKEVANLCTDITESEEIIGFSRDRDGDIRVDVWSRDCGNDSYCFPLKYLAMKDDEIEECEKKEAERLRRLAEEEIRKEREKLERQERREYERLKKKYEGSSKKVGAKGEGEK